MQSTPRLGRSLGLCAFALTGVLALAACGDDDDTTEAAATPSTSASAPVAAPPSAGTAATFGEADVMFAQMMIPHHEQAVEMARQAPAKAANPEVKKLAATIEAAQAPEIAQLKAWLTAWGRPTVAPAGHGGHDMDGMMSDADMRRFGASSGTEFDRLFLEMMIVHHEGAITMAREELAEGTDPKARELAKAIETSQAAEVAHMRTLLGAPTGAPTTSAPAHH